MSCMLIGVKPAAACADHGVQRHERVATSAARREMCVVNGEKSATHGVNCLVHALRRSVHAAECGGAGAMCAVSRATRDACGETSGGDAASNSVSSKKGPVSETAQRDGVMIRVRVPAPRTFGRYPPGLSYPLDKRGCSAAAPCSCACRYRSRN
jgi:hypothetical protein